MSTFKFINKFACGAYFNSARDNFHRAMLDILQQIGVSKHYTETELDDRLAEILNVLKGEPSPISEEDAKKIIANQTMFRQLLFRRFPILGPVISDVLHFTHRQKEKIIMKELIDERVHDLIMQNEAEEDYYLSNEQMVQQAEKEIKEALKTKKKKIIVDDCGDRDATCAECLDAILLLARCLTDCRNYFTHYLPYNPNEILHNMYSRQCKAATWLNPVFTASRRLDKRRNRLTSAQLEFITNHNYKAKTDENGRKVKDENGKDIYIKDHSYYFSIIGESFIAKRNGDEYVQKDIENDSSAFGNCENNALSDFGLMYLCCCFLTRSQAQQFAEKAKLFANSPENMTERDFQYVLNVSAEAQPNNIQLEELNRLKTKLRVDNLDLSKEKDRAAFTALQNDRSYWQKTSENMLLQEMLSIYRVRLPRGKRLDKQDNATTVALDMLNELRRCPKELFDILPTEGQQAFADPVNNEEGETENSVARKRFTDRFPYLALRAIDEANLLPSIRFQVQLGYYRFAFYNKTCIDGSSQLRRLGKALNGFGRLSAMESRRKTEWAPEDSESEIQQPNRFQRKIYTPTRLEDGKTVLDLLRPVEDKVGNEPYITDTAASYNIYNNRIGLYWEEQNGGRKNDDILEFPELRTKDTDKVGTKRPEVPQKAPLCTLSVRDLPALLFLLHINGYNSKAVEDIIVNKYKGLLKFFSDISRKPEDGANEPTLESIRKEITSKGIDTVLKGYNLKLSDIPYRLKECLPLHGASGKTSDAMKDIVSYFRELLSGTKYALADDATEEKISELIYNVGYSKSAKDLPNKYLKKLTQLQIVQTGIETLMRSKGKKPEDLPENIHAFVFNNAEPIQASDPGLTTDEANPVTARFLQMLMGDGDQNEGRLERRLQWVDGQLAKFSRSSSAQFAKDNRYATKGYKDVRYSRLAEILAESMLLWLPTKDVDDPIERGRNKLTGLNYRRLVDFLAIYSEDSTAKKEHDGIVDEYSGLEALECVLNEAKLIGSVTYHPFLSAVLKKAPRNIENLYLAYMNAEKNYLINLKKTFAKKAATDKIEDLQSQAPAFVHPFRERWTDKVQEADNVRRMAARYLESGSTLLLPDGLFTDAILSQLQRRGLLQDVFAEAANEQDETEKELLEQRNRNVSFLISRYMESMGDHCQTFYDGDTPIFYRGYDLFKKLYGKKVRNEQLPFYMSRDVIAAELKAKEELVKKIETNCVQQNKAEAEEGMIRDINHIKNNERAILRYKVQDMVLFLTAKKMLQSQQALQDGNATQNQESHRVNLGRQTQAAYVRQQQTLLNRSERIERMRLQDVFDGDALNETMDYEYRIDVTWKLRDEQGRVLKFKADGQPIGFDEDGNLLEKGGKPKVFKRKVFVTQKNVAIKNFGRIFRIVRDERLEKLLILLIMKVEGASLQETGQDYTVSVAELANEFTTFDSLRTDAFELIHELEKTAYPCLTNKESNETFQFKNMMRLICDTEEEAVAINQYRISFAHSLYGIEETSIGDGLQIPLVSTRMKEQMAARSQQIKEHLAAQN